VVLICTGRTPLAYEFEHLKLPGVVLFHTRRFGDDRGFFMERYRQSELEAAGIHERFVQSNMSRSGKDILRGIHYQAAPQGQGKLVQVPVGAVFDVAVDVDPASPNFGQWIGVELSAENGDLLYVPGQYGHAFCTLSDDAIVLYDVTNEYVQELERGVLWNDPTIGIDWPVKDPITSQKDTTWPTLESLRVAAGR